MKWLLIVENSAAFGNDEDYSYLSVNGEFEKEEEAEEALDKYHLGNYENLVFIVKGKNK